MMPQVIGKPGWHKADQGGEAIDRKHVFNFWMFTQGKTADTDIGNRHLRP